MSNKSSSGSPLFWFCAISLAVGIYMNWPSDEPYRSPRDPPPEIKIVDEEDYSGGPVPMHEVHEKVISQEYRNYHQQLILLPVLLNRVWTYQQQQDYLSLTDPYFGDRNRGVQLDEYGDYYIPDYHRPRLKWQISKRRY